MKSSTLPVDFRTFVVFTTLSLTFLPMCAPGGSADAVTSSDQRVEVSAPEDTHQPPAGERAAGSKHYAAVKTTTTRIA